MTTVSGPSCAATACECPWKGEKYHVVPLEYLDGGGLQHSTGQWQQMRLVLGQGVAGAGIRGQRADLDRRMPQEQPKNLAAGVPAAPATATR